MSLSRVYALRTFSTLSLGSRDGHGGFRFRGLSVYETNCVSTTSDRTRYGLSGFYRPSGNSNSRARHTQSAHSRVTSRLARRAKDCALSTVQSVPQQPSMHMRSPWLGSVIVAGLHELHAERATLALPDGLRVRAPALAAPTLQGCDASPGASRTTRSLGCARAPPSARKRS